MFGKFEKTVALIAQNSVYDNLRENRIKGFWIGQN